MLFETKKPIKITETIFDILYLGIVLFFAIFLLYRDISLASPKWVFGLTVLILFLGDATHLIPRISAMWNKESKMKPWIGYGKMATSLTITLFYVGLWYLGIITFETTSLFATKMTVAFLGLAFFRIVFCLLPQNKWKEDNASFAWVIIRNIPFILMGIFVIVQYFIGGEGGSLANSAGGLQYLGILIIISFAFYIPVLFLAKKYPKVGMLMMLKTIAYVAIIIVGCLSFPS